MILSRAQYRTGRDVSWAVPGTTIRWVPNFGVHPHTHFGKLIIMLTYIVWGAFFSLFGPPVNRNIFLTQPPLFSLWGGVLKLVRGQDYSQVLMDIYPEVAIEAGLLSPSSPITRLLNFLAHSSLKFADRIIVIGRCMERRVIDMGINPNYITFIPNWADQEAIYPIKSEENPLRREWGWQNKFVVLYSGNIGVSHFFDDLLEVCRRLRNNHNLVFAFIGEGQRLNDIKAFKEAYNLDNIVILPFQDQTLLARSLSAGDIHFVSLRNRFEGLVVPSKTYGILAAGRPVLYQGPPNSEIAQLIETEKVGTVVPLDDADQLEEVILNYVNHRDLTQCQGRLARQLSETTLSRNVACQSYAVALGLKSSVQTSELVEI